MYSNIISPRPHHACDVTLATIFSYEKIYECKRDGDIAGVTPAARLEIAVDQERRLVNIIINGKA